MTMFFASLLTFLIAFLALSVGMIFGKARIKGHCGGPGNDDDCCDGGSHPVVSGAQTAESQRIQMPGKLSHPCDTCSCDR